MYSGEELADDGALDFGVDHAVMRHVCRHILHGLPNCPVVRSIFNPGVFYPGATAAIATEEGPKNF